jgi:hypothetical protein
VNAGPRAGGLALAGALVVAVGCWLPYATEGHQDYHVFERRAPHAVLWFALEPAAVVAVAAVLGVMLLRGSTLGPVYAGILLTMGCQTALLFLGYVGSTSQGSFEQKTGPGGWIGLVGSVLIGVAGVVMIQGGRDLQAQPAGWYSDPGEPERLRYWSGSTWTEHTHDQPPAAPGA